MKVNIRTGLVMATVWTVVGYASALAADALEFELVLWNQHNGPNRDRGTKTCKVEVFRGNTLLWKKDKINVAWAPDADPKTSIPIPRLSGLPGLSVASDRIRISITEFMGNGGGLSEVELMRGGENIAPKCKVTASGLLDIRFRPETVIDGIRSSDKKPIGYWLLPQKSKGWIELQLPKN